MFTPTAPVETDTPSFTLALRARHPLVPVDETRRFFEALRSVSRAPVAYAEIEGAQHAFEIFPSLRTKHVMDGATRFLAFLRGGAVNGHSGRRPSARR